MNNNSGAANFKELTSLLQGERFIANIADIKPDVVVLRLEDGSTFNARSLSVPEARIGQYAQFIVKENDGKGRIVLELAKGADAGVKGFGSLTREILLNLRLPLVKENFELVNALIENKMPTDKATINNGLFFKYTSGSLEQAIFLLKEEFPLVEGYVKAFDFSLSEKNSFKSMIDELARNILSLTDEEAKNEALRIICGSEDLSETGDLSACLSVELNNEVSFNHINNYYNNLLKTLINLKKIFSGSGPEHKRVLGALNRLENSILFMNNINKNKSFVQIPVLFEKTLFQCDIYIFKDVKSSLTEKASILVCFDTKILGYIEMLINKDNNNLSMQFNVRNNETEKILSENIERLTKIFKRKGYTLSKIEYGIIDKPFNLLKNFKRHENEEPVKKRYSFDMRV